MLYVALSLGSMFFAAVASWWVRSAFDKYSQLSASSGLTGEQAAQRILERAGITDVQVHEIGGVLSDHYDPRNKVLALCSQNFRGTSVAAIGVAAHEAGHALQHQASYLPLHLRMAAVGITTKAGMIIPIIGVAGMLIGQETALILMCIAMGIIMAFQLITLPVEFDATARAKRMVAEMNLVAPGDETTGMNRVLRAAAMTYVAAFLSALVQFLHVLMRLMNQRERR